VTFARRAGWAGLANGELIQKTEDAGFDLLLNTDKNIRYQQNLRDRKIALVVLGNGNWPIVEPHIEAILAAVNLSTPGSNSEVPIPFPRAIPRETNA
jgi:hypothetical protein